MNSLIASAADWFDDRTGLVSAVKRFLDEDIPASSGWHQVFGSVALFLFVAGAEEILVLLVPLSKKPLLGPLRAKTK